MIVEEEQGGKARAEYGRGLMKELSAFLSERFGRGYSLSTLKNAKKFYNVYAPAILQKMAAESSGEKSQTLFSLLDPRVKDQKSQTLFSFSDWVNIPQIQQTKFAESHPFALRWLNDDMILEQIREIQRTFGTRAVYLTCLQKRANT